MDKTWINDLTDEFRKKIFTIVNIWLEIGVANEKFVTRSNSLKLHVDNLLNDMIDEENIHKFEVEKSVECLTIDVRKLCTDLKIDYHDQLSESLVTKESNLLTRKTELEAIKDIRMKKFHSLLDLEDKLCERLHECRLNLDAKLIPTEQQLDTLEMKINELDRIKKNRTNTFLIKRDAIIHYLTMLDKIPPTDVFIDSIYSDESDIKVPLSMDFLNECDRLINQLKSEHQTNINEYIQLRQRYKSLHTVLFPNTEIPISNSHISSDCDNCSYTILNLLQNDVSRLENVRLEKMGEFIKTYQLQIREKLCENFSGHRQNSDRYRALLNTDDVNESLLTKLEAELEQLSATERKLEPLKALIDTWEKLFGKLIEINANLKNPIILKNRGGILLKVEKEKNAVKKDLPKCEAKIRDILSSLGEKQINSCDLKINDIKIDDYILSMWEQLEGEKENEKKDRKLKPLNSKLDVSKGHNTVKKPLQNTNQKSFVSNKL